MLSTSDRRRGAGLLLALLLAAPAALRADPRPPEEEISAAIQSLLERNGPQEPLSIDGTVLASTVILPEFYVGRRFRPAWSDGADVQALFEVIGGSATHGLDPADYHAAALARLRPRAADDAWSAATFDLLATDAVVRLGRHLRLGKVDPQRYDATWNFARSLPDADYPSMLEDALERDRLAEALASLAPQSWLYESLRRALAKLRGSEPWPRVSAGPTLRPGDSGARVIELRARLAASGDLPDGSDRTSPVYDDALVEAVRSYQRGQGLDVDGVVGARSLAALNVPVAARIDQLRVNLERARWVLQGLPARFVLVNVPSFEAFYFETQALRWHARAQVGREARRTPIFRAELTHVVFNPTWTVPPGILAKDILSHGASAPAIVKRKGLRLLDRSGREVDPARVDWTRYTASSLPYTLRQDPGPANALGRIKFMFPNPHLVYLHDTPSKQLFQRGERAFSSGCIRIEHPLELAALLLAGWTREQIDAAIATGRTRTVFLEQPVPILLLYWTAVPRPSGAVDFARDLYGLDPRVLAVLEQPFDPTLAAASRGADWRPAPGGRRGTRTPDPLGVNQML